MEKIIKNILSDIENDTVIADAICFYGEWNSTKMWEAIRPLIEIIIKKHLDENNKL